MQTYCSCCLHLVLQNESVSGPYFLYNSLTFFCTWRECEISVLALTNGENSFLIFVWNVLGRMTPRLKRISPHVQVGIQFTFIIINHHHRVSQATWTICAVQVGCHRFTMTGNFDRVHDVGKSFLISQKNRSWKTRQNSKQMRIFGNPSRKLTSKFIINIALFSVLLETHIHLH